MPRNFFDGFTWNQMVQTLGEISGKMLHFS
jgi:hypothetical protein